jgi:WD40 repeat protein
MLYECLAGKRPFLGQPPALLAAICNDEPVRIRTIAPPVPKDLETVCLKCLVKEPAGRYASAGVLADELNRWLRGEPVFARPLTIAERATRWVRKNPSLSGMAAIVGLLVIAIAIGSTTAAGFLLASRAELQSALNEATVAEVRIATEAQKAEQQSLKSQELAAQAEKALQELKREMAAREQAEQATRDEVVARKAAEANAIKSAAARSTAEADAKSAAAIRDEAIKKHPALLYADNIAHVRALLARSDFAEAREVLDKCSAEHRSWEWGHYNYLCKNNMQFPPALPQKGSAAAISPLHAPGRITFNPDSSLIRYGNAIWDVGTHQRLWSRQHATKTRNSLFTFSRDWHIVLEQTPDNVAFAADITSGQEPRELTAMVSLALSPNGNRIAGSDIDRTGAVPNAHIYKLFDDQGTLLRTLPNATEHVHFRNAPSGRVEFSPCGRWLVITDGDLCLLCDSATGRVLHDFKDVTHFALQKQGTMCCIIRNGGASSTKEATAELWDITRNKTIKSWSVMPKKYAQATFSPEGRWIVVQYDLNSDLSTLICSAKTGETVAQLTKFTKVTFAPDESRCACNLNGKTVVNDLETGEVIDLPQDNHMGGFEIFNINGRRLVAHQKQPLGFAVVDLGTGNLICSTPEWPVRFSADEKRLFCKRHLAREGLVNKYSLSIIDLNHGTKLWEIDDLVVSFAISPDGLKLAAVNRGGQLRVWISDPN